MRQLLLISLLAACGTTGSGTKLPESRERTVVGGIRKTVDYASLGRPEPLGKTIEIVGADTIWIKGEQVLITLDKTSWETMGNTRAGKARFIVSHEGADTVLTVEEGRSKSAYGFTITVELAYEIYSKERLSTVPHAKFTVTK